MWTFTELIGLDPMLTLASINCRIPLREIYDRLNLPPDSFDQRQELA